jgi:hypothetical protein
MARPWIDVDPPADEPAPKPSKAGPWAWVKRLVLFPFRLVGLICVAVLILGGPSMWTIPDVASRRGVDMSLLVLRVLDDDSPARPFRRLGYQDAIQPQLLDLQPSASDKASASTAKSELKDEVAAVSSKRTTAGEVYTIRYASGKTQTITATTPHTTVPAEDLSAARRAIRRFYPRQSKEWPEVLAWGEGLFVSSWVNRYDPEKAPRERFSGPAGGTEEEQLWCVWQVLRSGGAPAEDLSHLPELFANTFPDRKDQEAALTWAHTLYHRLNRAFVARKPYYETSKDAHSGHEGVLNAYRSLPGVLPPETRWTHLWLLQQYVGLSPAAQEAARLRWLKCLPESRQSQVLELGAKLLDERRSKGEALPNVPEVLPALCVIERLTGTDGHGQDTQEAVDSLPQLKLLVSALQFAYPNDDLFYVLAAGNRLDFYPSVHQDPADPAPYYLAVLMFVLAITGLASLGIKTAVGFVGNRVTRWTGNRELWDKSQNSRGKGCWWLSLLSLLLFSSIGYLLAPLRLPQAVLVQVGSKEELFFGALMATAMGGLLITACRRVLSLFLVTFGVDVTKTWADAVLGILFGGYILHHFGNDLVAIGLFALFDLTPGLVLAGRQRLRKRPPEPRPTVMPSARTVPQARTTFLPTS